MKLFQQLLVAPAALGLMAPLAANAADLNINGVSDYTSGSEVQNFSDVYPTDWAYQALTSFAERHGCAVANPSGSITRYEAASLLNNCLGNVAQVSPEERRLLNEFAPELAIIRGRVDGLEARVGAFEAGQFSDTTTLTGKAAFIVGSVSADDEVETDALTMEFMYTLNMNTSFNGDDLLYARIKSGNVSDHFKDKSNGTYLSATHSNTDQNLDIDKLWYTFKPTDSTRVWVGPKIENYYMLASAPSIYKPVMKQFALGGNGPVYGSSTTGGFGAAWTQQVDDPSTPRFEVSAAYTSKNSTSSAKDEGMFGKDAATALLTKVGYGAPRWQVSLAAAFKDNAWQDEYFATDDAKARSAATDETALGLRAYWKPEEIGVIPAVQVGYDTTSINNQVAGRATEASGWMIGLGWKDVIVDGNTAGLAIGSRVSGSEIKGGGTDPASDTFSWEAYYTFKVSDNISITPAIFGNEEPSNGNTVDDNSGYVVLTEFRF